MVRRIVFICDGNSVLFAILNIIIPLDVGGYIKR